MSYRMKLMRTAAAILLLLARFLFGRSFTVPNTFALPLQITYSGEKLTSLRVRITIPAPITAISTSMFAASGAKAGYGQVFIQCES